MPPRDDQYDETESMSIPISPARVHPSGRQPLQLSNPLPWPGCYVRTLLTERQVRISSVSRNSQAPQTPRSGSSSSTTTLATSVVTVADAHLRKLVTLSDADQRNARAPEIVMPRSDSDSELTRAHTRDSVDRDSWTEEAGFHAPNRLFLSFDVWLDPTTCSDLPEPNKLRKELEQLYMCVTYLSILPGFDATSFVDSRRKTLAGRRGGTDELDALTRVRAQSAPPAL